MLDLNSPIANYNNPFDPDPGERAIPFVPNSYSSEGGMIALHHQPPVAESSEMDPLVIEEPPIYSP
jgi:hypothetical protein